MTVGASILNLLGQQDPRTSLLQAMVAGQGGAQYAAGAGQAGGAAGTDPAGGAGVQAAQPQEAEAYKSPADLSAMMSELIRYEGKARNIDRGFGLIGSAISQDGNREATLNAFTGGNSGTSGTNMEQMAGTIMELNKMQSAQAARAAQLAALPAIAKQYGLSMETARYLMDSGKLDSVLAEFEKPNVEIVKDANGQNLLIDKTGRSQVGTFGTETDTRKVIDGPDGSKVQVDADGNIIRQVTGPDTMTSETREYDAYVRDELARGNANPMSLQEFRMTKPPSTSITNKIGEGDTEFAKAVSKDEGERYVGMLKQADNARQMLDQFDIVAAGIDSGVRTGTLGEAELSLRKIGQLIGVNDADDPKVVGGELIQKVSNRMALLMRNPESGMGMPGSVSDKDIEFLKQSQIGLGTSSEGNKQSLEIFRRIERRKIAIAQLAEDYVAKNGSLKGFNRAATEYNEANPMFADLNLVKQTEDERRQSVYKKYGIGQ